MDPRSVPKTTAKVSCVSAALDAAAVSNGLLVVADAVSVLTGKTHSERGDEGLRKSHVASILEYETMEDWNSVTVTLEEPVTTNTTGSMISVLVCHLSCFDSVGSCSCYELGLGFLSASTKVRILFRREPFSEQFISDTQSIMSAHINLCGTRTGNRLLPQFC